MVLRMMSGESENAKTPEKPGTEVSRPETERSHAKRNVGIDLGFGFVKLLEGQQPINFPAVVGVGRKLSYLSHFYRHDRLVDNLHIKLNDKEYFVGNLAIRQSDMPSRSLNHNRVDDRNAKVLLLAGLSLAGHPEQLTVNVVTGLPTSHYAGYYLDWMQELKGQYTVTLEQQDQPRHKRINIKDARILPQPFGTLYDQMLNSNGRLVNQELADMTVGIVDVGFKTTDFAVADRLEFIEHLSASTNFGMADVHRLMSEHLHKTYKLDKKDFELDQIVEQGTIRVAGTKQDLSDVKREIFQETAQKLITEISSRWDYRDFDAILLTGGGGRALAEYILPAFPNLRLVDNAQFGNVRGYQKLAHNIFDGD